MGVNATKRMGRFARTRKVEVPAVGGSVGKKSRRAQKPAGVMRRKRKKEPAAGQRLPKPAMGRKQLVNIERFKFRGVKASVMKGKVDEARNALVKAWMEDLAFDRKPKKWKIKMQSTLQQFKVGICHGGWKRALPIQFKRGARKHADIAADGAGKHSDEAAGGAGTSAEAKKGSKAPRTDYDEAADGDGTPAEARNGSKAPRNDSDEAAAGAGTPAEARNGSKAPRKDYDEAADGAGTPAEARNGSKAPRTDYDEAADGAGTSAEAKRGKPIKYSGKAADGAGTSAGEKKNEGKAIAPHGKKGRRS